MNDLFGVPSSVVVAYVLGFFLNQSDFNEFCTVLGAIDNYLLLDESAILDYRQLYTLASSKNVSITQVFTNIGNLQPIYSYIFLVLFSNEAISLGLLVTENTISLRESIRSFTFIFMYWILVFVFIYYTYLNLFSGSVLARYNGTSLYFESYVASTLEEAEKELSAIDDSAVFIGFFIAMYGWFFFSIVTPFELGSTLIHSMIIMFIFVTCMPLSTFYDYGACFFVYLRGASASTFFTLELLYDCLTTAIVITRLLVQSLRFVLMFVGYLELSEFLYNESWFNFLHWNYNLSIHPDYLNPSVLNDLLYTCLVIVPQFMMLSFYYLGHLLFVLVSQFCAFFMLVFWLFSFLYTYFNSEVFEKHFNVKRKTVKKNRTL